MIEKLAISHESTPGLTLHEAVDAYLEARAGGIGLSERLLPESGDAGVVGYFVATGLRATLSLPSVSAILPAPDDAGPADPVDRIDAICASVRRLGEFDPTAVFCQTGPRGSFSAIEARELVVSGLRKIARKAATARHREILVGLEPGHPSAEASLVTSLRAAAELVEEVGEPNLGLVLDTWQLGEASELLDEIAEWAHLIVGVQISDRRATARSERDRLLPGDGELDLAAILEALEAAAYQGWYELEIVSDSALPDSPWRRLAPVELASAGRAAFRRLWKPRLEPAKLDTW